MKKIAVYFLGICLIVACGSDCKDDKCVEKSNPKITGLEGTIAQNSDHEVSCKLTLAELQQRKETVLESLKKKLKDKKELSNGYSFKFEGSDEVFDELTSFIKSERSCCSFFVFTLSVSGDGNEAWLSMSGPEGAKEMIANELGL